MPIFIPRDLWTQFQGDAIGEQAKRITEDLTRPQTPPEAPPPEPPPSSDALTNPLGTGNGPAEPTPQPEVAPQPAPTPPPEQPAPSTVPPLNDVLAAAGLGQPQAGGASTVPEAPPTSSGPPALESLLRGAGLGEVVDAAGGAASAASSSVSGAAAPSSPPPFQDLLRSAGLMAAPPAASSPQQQAAAAASVPSAAASPQDILSRVQPFLGSQYVWGGKTPQSGFDCLIKGTLVTTQRGEVPIEQIKPGDYALTRDGLRRVQWLCLKREDADLWAVELADGQRLIGTADHRVWAVNRGWVPLSTIQMWDTLATCKSSATFERSPSSRAGATTATRSRQKIATESISSGQGSRCMSRFGNPPTGRSQQGMRCITPITTRSTTMSPISIAFLSQPIERNQPPAVCRSISPVRSAARDSWEQTQRAQSGGSAASGVSSAGRTRTSIASSAHARSAALPSWPTATKREPVAPSVVPAARVRSVGRLGLRGAVYDLSVEDSPEFFANGILVHNCSGLAGFLTTGQAESTTTLYGKSAAIDPQALQPGDLVFYNMGQSDMHLQHVGVYIGDGKLVQAGGTQNTVNIADVNQHVGSAPEFRRVNGGTPQQTGGAPAQAAGNTVQPVTPTTAALSGGGQAASQVGDRGQQLLAAGAQAASWLGDQGQKALQAVLVTEGGLNGARGDQGKSAGPLQFYEGGQLANLAKQFGMGLDQAKQWVEQNPEAAIQWAIGTPDKPGYLGAAIQRGQQQGLSGADLATYVQRTGQVSVSPERAGANFQALFGGGQAAIQGAAGAVQGAATNTGANLLSSANSLVGQGQRLLQQVQPPQQAQSPTAPIEQEANQRMANLNAQLDQTVQAGQQAQDQRSVQAAQNIGGGMAGRAMYQVGQGNTPEELAAQAAPPPAQPAQPQQDSRPMWERIGSAIGQALQPLVESVQGAVGGVQSPNSGNPVVDTAGTLASAQGTVGHLAQQGVESAVGAGVQNLSNAAQTLQPLGTAVQQSPPAQAIGNALSLVGEYTGGPSGRFPSGGPLAGPETGALRGAEGAQQLGREFEQRTGVPYADFENMGRQLSAQLADGTITRDDPQVQRYMQLEQQWNDLAAAPGAPIEAYARAGEGNQATTEAVGSTVQGIASTALVPGAVEGSAAGLGRAALSAAVDPGSVPLMGLQSAGSLLGGASRAVGGLTREGGPVSNVVEQAAHYLPGTPEARVETIMRSAAQQSPDGLAHMDGQQMLDQFRQLNANKPGPFTADPTQAKGGTNVLLNSGGMPGIDDIRALVEAGMVHKDWYINFADRAAQAVGEPNIPEFFTLFAITSSQTKVKRNVWETLNTMQKVREAAADAESKGQDVTQAVVDLIRDKSRLSLAGKTATQKREQIERAYLSGISQVLSGAKTSSYAGNLDSAGRRLFDPRTTNDVWVWRAFNVSNEEKPVIRNGEQFIDRPWESAVASSDPAYRFSEAVLNEIAREKGLQGHQVQASMWASINSMSVRAPDLFKRYQEGDFQGAIRDMTRRGIVAPDEAYSDAVFDTPEVRKLIDSGTLLKQEGPLEAANMTRYYAGPKTNPRPSGAAFREQERMAAESQAPIAQTGASAQQLEAAGLDRNTGTFPWLTVPHRVEDTPAGAVVHLPGGNSDTARYVGAELGSRAGLDSVTVHAPIASMDNVAGLNLLGEPEEISRLAADLAEQGVGSIVGSTSKSIQVPLSVDAANAIGMSDTTSLARSIIKVASDAGIAPERIGKYAGTSERLGSDSFEGVLGQLGGTFASPGRSGVSAGGAGAAGAVPGAVANFAPVRGATLANGLPTVPPVARRAAIGAVGAGYQAAQQPNATPESVATGAAQGAALGAGRALVGRAIPGLRLTAEVGRVAAAIGGPPGSSRSFDLNALSQMRRQFQGQQPPLVTVARTVSPVDRFVGYTAANMLSGIGTAIQNTIGNVGQALVRPAITLAAGYPVDAYRDVAAMGAALGDAFAAYGRTFRTGQRSSQTLQAPITGSLANPLSYPMRNLSATDEFFRTLNSSGAAAAEASRRLRENPALSFNDVLSRYQNEIVEAAADGSARGVFERGGGMAGDFGGWVADRRQELLNSNNPRAVAGGLALQWLMPMTRVPGVILGEGFRNLPVVNEVRGVQQAVQFGRAGNTNQARRELARAGLVSMMNFGIWSQVQQGNVTGDGPTNPSDRQRLTEAVDAQGNPVWRPNSIRVGGRWFDYAGLGPLALPMSSIANLVDSLNDYAQRPPEQRDPNAVPDVASQLLNREARTIGNAWYLRGIADLLGAISDGTVSGQAATFTQVADRLVPAEALLNEIRHMTDPLVREPQGVLEREANRLPLASQTVPPRISATTGQPQESPEDLLSTLVRGTPGGFTPNPVATEISRLNESGSRVNVPYTKKSYASARQTPEQERLIHEQVGTAVNLYVSNMMQAPQYAQLDDKQKADALSKAIGNAQHIADIQLGSQVARSPHENALMQWAQTPQYYGVKGTPQQIAEQNWRISEAKQKLSDYKQQYGSRAAGMLYKEDKEAYKLSQRRGYSSQILDVRKKRLDQQLGGALTKAEDSAAAGGLVGAGSTVIGP